MKKILVAALLFLPLVSFADTQSQIDDILARLAVLEKELAALEAAATPVATTTPATSTPLLLKATVETPAAPVYKPYEPARTSNAYLFMGPKCSNPNGCALGG